MLDPSGLATTYTYNGFSELLTLQSPDTRQTTSTYDEAGNLKTRTDARGITATYGYDLLNRVECGLRSAALVTLNLGQVHADQIGQYVLGAVLRA